MGHLNTLISRPAAKWKMISIYLKNTKYFATIPQTQSTKYILLKCLSVKGQSTKNWIYV